MGKLFVFERDKKEILKITYQESMSNLKYLTWSIKSEWEFTNIFAHVHINSESPKKYTFSVKVPAMCNET